MNSQIKIIVHFMVITLKYTLNMGLGWKKQLLFWIIVIVRMDVI